MSEILSEVQLVLLAAAVFFVFASLVSTPLAYGIERATRDWAPAARHRALVWTTAMPLILAVAALLATLAPSAIALALTGPDHCATHDDGHAHLCFVHFPKHGPSGIAWLVLAAGGAWLAARATEGITDLLRAHRIVRPLVALATSIRGRCSIVPSKRPFCLTVGLFRPRVLVSEGFLERTHPMHLRAVLLHEGAHVSRKDAVVSLVARAASLLFPPTLRHRLRAEVDVAAERACDESAACTLGDRLSVAETILSIERLLQADADLHSLPLVRAVGSVAVSRRVEALLEPVKTKGATRAVVLALAGVVTMLFTLSQPIHHAVESLLAFVLHASG